MENKRKKAINNNLALYKAVFSSHDKQLQVTEDVYYLEEKTPPLYSNLVTRTASWTPDEEFKTIDQNCSVQGWKEWSIKDSFQCLDLTGFGFEKLFDSKWLYLEATNFVKPDLPLSIDFRVANNNSDLLSWIETWGEGLELGKQIYNEKLLTNPDIIFVTGYVNEKPKYVALLNKSDDVVGISNFFVPENTREIWTELISWVHGEFGKVDIVGYEDTDMLSKIASLGVEEVGDLTVWIKKI
jgi:hypothetical protein